MYVWIHVKSKLVQSWDLALPSPYKCYLVALVILWYMHTITLSEGRDLGLNESADEIFYETMVMKSSAIEIKEK